MKYVSPLENLRVEHATVSFEDVKSVLNLVDIAESETILRKRLVPASVCLYCFTTELWPEKSAKFHTYFIREALSSCPFAHKLCWKYNLSVLSCGLQTNQKTSDQIKNLSE
jgi:hypothetical protein